MAPDTDIKKTILVHSADKDLARSLTILLQEKYNVIATHSVSELTSQRKNTKVDLLVADVEKNIPQVIEEFRIRKELNPLAPVIVLYAFRQQQPSLERSLREMSSALLYKPVAIEQVLSTIGMQLTQYERMSARHPQTIHHKTGGSQ